MTGVVELTIESVGARGDGIAEDRGTRVFVPCTLPGERVRVRLGRGRGRGRARLVEIIVPSPERIGPSCPHFGRCGGCAVPHMRTSFYLEWKRSRVVTALARHGFANSPVRATVGSPPQSRRRTVLTAARHGKGAPALGFHARMTHDVKDIGSVCPVLDPDLRAQLAPVRVLLESTVPQSRRIAVGMTLTDSGIDMLLASREEPGLCDREALAAFAASNDIARIAWRRAGTGEDELVVSRRPVRQHFGKVAVSLPPGAFLQATRQGEAALVGFAANACREAGRVADLYAGCGTFRLPLAMAGMRVHCVEGAPAQIAALQGAANAAGLSGRVTTEARDLEQRPLGIEELAGFDVVVFDPPRSGARTQAEAIAASTVPIAVAVSCNPATFARDARILADGGFRLEEILPVDQFLWSPQVELAALFRREGSFRA